MKKNFNKIITIIILIVFIAVIKMFFSNYSLKKRHKITNDSAIFLQKKILEYKKYYNKYPAALNNLITDTYVINNSSRPFIAAVPPELVTEESSNKVQVGGQISKSGSGWWYNNTTGELKINNTKILSNIKLPAFKKNVD